MSKTQPPAPKRLTLEEHNAWIGKIRRVLAADTQTGVSCSACGAEMVFTNPGQINLTKPPSRSVHCPKCKNSGLMM